MDDTPSGLLQSIIPTLEKCLRQANDPNAAQLSSRLHQSDYENFSAKRQECSQILLVLLVESIFSFIVNVTSDACSSVQCPGETWSWTAQEFERKMYEKKWKQVNRLELYESEESCLVLR